MGGALPQLLREVAEIAGLEAALRLARARGGRSVYVPAEPTPGFLAEVGEEAARALSSLYPNEEVSVPLGPTGVVQATKRLIGDALRENASASEAARRAGVTERTIYNHRRRRREQDARQQRLFRD